MNRKGFALLPVLWIAAALGVALAGSLAEWRAAAQTSRNRLQLTRTRWAQEACLALVQASAEEGAKPNHPERVDLGQGLWCTAEVGYIAGDSALRMVAVDAGVLGDFKSTTMRTVTRTQGKRLVVIDREVE